MDNPNNHNETGRGVVSDAEGDLSRAQQLQQQMQQQEPAGENLMQNNQEQAANEAPQEQPRNPARGPPVGPQQPQPPVLPPQQQMPPFAPGPSWPHPQNPMIPPNAPPAVAPQPPPPPSQHAIAMAQYYEARMRDHAAAYASAAAGAAWAAAQIAAQAAEFAASTSASTLPPPPPDPSSRLPPPHFDPSNIPPPALPMPPAPGMYYPAGNSNNANAAMYNGSHPMGGPPPMGSPHAAAVDPSNNNLFYGHSQGEFRDGGGGEGEPYWQQQQPSPQHNKRNNKNNDTDDSYEYRNNRRKRMTRRPPGGISIPRHHNNYNNNNNNNPGNNNNNYHHNDTPRNNQNQGNGANNRRRLRDEHSSNSSCCSGSLGTSIASYNSDQAMSGGHPNNNHNNNNTNNTYAGHNSSGGGHRGNNYFRGGGRGNHYHRYKKKQRQPPSDNSLYGKTPVAALYEWCDKRRLGQPSFALLSQVSKEGGGPEGAYEFSCLLEDGVEWGRGRGTNKASAKQDAARKALMQLLPGVQFDPESGILVALPSPSPVTSPQAAVGGGRPNHHHQQQRQPSSLEDLAPHLAQRLAIASGREDDYDDGNNQQPRGAVDYSSKKLKRAWSVYPGTTSTTNSEEDDENAWYASRGASVCSALLHAMVQIDDRIPEGPQYTFIMTETQTTNAQMKRKGPASSSSGTIVIHRGSFTCNATLQVLCNSPSRPHASGNSEDPNSPEPAECSNAEALDKEASSPITKGQPKEDTEAAESEVSETPRKSAATTSNDGAQVKVLEAVGVASTKRESRHSASAKLLAMLFPECRSMVEVKAAAEAAREAYAAKKQQSKQSSRNFANASNRRRHNRRDRSKIPRLSLSQLNAICTSGENDPPLPDFYAGELRSILGIQQQQDQENSSATTICSQVMGFEKLNLNQDATVESASNQKEEENGGIARSRKPTSSTEGDVSTGHIESNSSSVARQLSRQKQLEERVDKALQALNEHDDEGRSLPSQLTPDDVGRTVLRRATEVEDVERIKRLLSNGPPCGGQLPPVSILGAAASSCTGADYGAGEHSETSQDCGALALRLWGSSTIVLLLCRAIAAFEDPPLGCAVLTLGFSMTKGKVLRVAMIGSEPHLPRERFLEVLDTFATCMDCAMEREQDELRTAVRLQKRDLESVLRSHLGLRSARLSEESQSANFSAPLQSVREESEGGEDSDRSGDATGEVKGRDKPSKRSRVE
ncbi:expressed unknown protein [Seminavis robusta]|uniref:DRBM domain-containing protein n=1 Tax=Seminavis robusta TaxID=568900 RepID=A0A9N8HY43_9STRA|nr:expressed unknown protein [Seminavis robusta]|eukprot:Sro2694_g334860.1 n/a (1217) ;mRNA; f:2284-6013